MTKMLGRAGWRRVFIAVKHGDSRRCLCPECDIQPTKGTQRAREKRQWRREALT